MFQTKNATAEFDFEVDRVAAELIRGCEAPWVAHRRAVEIVQRRREDQLREQRRDPERNTNGGSE